MSPLERISRRTFLGDTLKFGAVSLTVPALAAAAPALREPWQIGCYTRPWDKYDYRVALDAIAEAGFEYVGLMTTKSETRLVISASTTGDEAARIGEEIKKRRLRVPSVYGGGIPVDKSLKAGIEALTKLIDSCAACGAKNLMMGGTGNSKLHSVYYKAVAECCDYAAEKRIGISIKPHGGLNATGPQCRKTIEMVANKNFRIWYDPGNIFYYSNAELDPVDDAATVDGLVVGMCIKDYKHPKNVMVTPGTGKVDFPKVMARLKKGGFTHGALVVECLAPGDLKSTLAEAKKARKFVEQLVARQTPAPVWQTQSSNTAASPAAPHSAQTTTLTLTDQQWPAVTGGHYIRWAGRVWNTRKPARIWQNDTVGTLAQHNGTAAYLGEDKADAGTVEFDVRFDPGYLATKGGGKHFMEIMTWVADRSDRSAIGKKPWSRIELANLGDRPRCLIWNYGSHFEGRATKIFSIGPAFEPDRWRHIRFDWRYDAPVGEITIHVDDRSYTAPFEFVPGTLGPGRFYLFGHVETEQPQGRMHFRNFKTGNRK